MIAAREADDSSLDSDDEDVETRIQQETLKKQEQQEDVERETLARLGLLARKWRDVQVGDILICFKNQAFAADMILLGSSDPKGLAFIETSSLDGETNLKLKQIAKGSGNLLSCSLPSALNATKELEGRVVAKQPNRDIGDFQGLLYLHSRCHSPDAFVSAKSLRGGPSYGLSQKGTMKPLPLAASQILLRGCRLRNTEWVIGLVVYTGRQTKIQMVRRRHNSFYLFQFRISCLLVSCCLKFPVCFRIYEGLLLEHARAWLPVPLQNSGASPRKVSRVERLTNRLTLSVWGLQVLLCLLASLLHLASVYWMPKREFYRLFAAKGHQSPATFCMLGFRV